MNNIEKIKNSMIRNYFNLPANLNLTILEKEFPPKFKRGKFNSTCAKIIIHELLKNINKNKDAIDYTYSSINSKQIEDEVYNYFEYLQWFKQCRIIEKKELPYRVNHYTKSYKFTPQYLNSPKSKVMATNADITGKLNKLRENKLPEQFIKDNEHLFKGFDKDLTIISTLTSEMIECECIDEEGVLNTKTCNNFKGQIQNIRAAKYYFFKVDKFGQRFYSPISNLKKCFRNYLRYKGETLVELDIKNSLPYMLNFILENNIEEFVEHRLKKGEAESIMLYNYKSLNFNELYNFKKLTTSGKIYEFLIEYLMSEIGENFQMKIKGFERKEEKQLPYNEIYPIKNYHSVHEQQREICKKLFIKHLFGKNGQEIYVDRFYYKHFPTILNFIDELKKGKCNEYKLISKLLMRVESFLVLEAITKEFCAENPEAVVFTIHDCIATQERFIDILETKAKEVFLRYLDTPPVFHRKRWCNDCDEYEIAA